jgi:hypothetical protein
MLLGKREYVMTTFADGVEGYTTKDGRYAYLEVDGKVVMRINNHEDAWRRVQFRAWDYAHERIGI